MSGPASPALIGLFWGAGGSIEFKTVVCLDGAFEFYNIYIYIYI